MASSDRDTPLAWLADCDRRIPATQRRPTAAATLEELRQSGFPEDYIAFLRDIGHGNLDVFRLFERPIPMDDAYEGRDGDEAWLVGDNFSGFFFGFDPRRDFALVEYDPNGDEQALDELSFRGYVVSRLKDEQL